MKLTCSTVIFNQLDLYGTLQHLAWAGYDGAELACLRSHARHVEPNTDKSYLDEIKWTAKKHGIALAAIHLDAGKGQLLGELLRRPIEIDVLLEPVVSEFHLPAQTVTVRDRVV